MWQSWHRKHDTGGGKVGIGNTTLDVAKLASEIRHWMWQSWQDSHLLPIPEIRSSNPTIGRGQFKNKVIAGPT